MWGKNRNKTGPFWNIPDYSRTFQNIPNHSRPLPQPLPLQSSSGSPKPVFYQHPPPTWLTEHRGLVTTATHFLFKLFYLGITVHSSTVTENSTEKPRVPLTQCSREWHPADRRCETTTRGGGSTAAQSPHPTAPPAVLSCPHPPPSYLNPWDHRPVLHVILDGGWGTGQSLATPQRMTVQDCFVGSGRWETPTADFKHHPRRTFPARKRLPKVEGLNAVAPVTTGDG